MQDSFMVTIKILEVLVENPLENIVGINSVSYNSTRLIVQQVTDLVLNVGGKAVHKTDISCCLSCSSLMHR